MGAALTVVVADVPGFSARSRRDHRYRGRHLPQQPCNLQQHHDHREAG